MNENSHGSLIYGWYIQSKGVTITAYIDRVWLKTPIKISESDRVVVRWTVVYGFGHNFVFQVRAEINMI